MNKTDILKSSLTLANDISDPAWRELECKVQARALNKSSTFKLEGTWKSKYVVQDGFDVFVVNSEWVKNNLNATFGHGGHGYVYEFIPLNEIWVSAAHNECLCINVKPFQPVSNLFLESTILHEIVEFKAMRDGKEYWEAHQIALQAELDAGLLEDPYKEIDV